MLTRSNPLLLTDSYKVGHWPQYPTGTTNVYSYFESRGGAYANTVFFGLQYILDRYIVPGFTLDDVYEADELFTAHFGSDSLFNKDGWLAMYARYMGAFPVRIKAVPEGTVVPTGNVLMTVENTDDEFPWLTNYLETVLSQVWYPTTVATISWHVRQKISQYLHETGDESGLDFKLHDFGFRGASSVESAALGGAAHLTSFLGTDTLAAIPLLRDHYGADMPGFSVPASEHSTMTAWGREHEADAYENMIETYGSFPYYSVVSDSYNIYEAVEKLWGGQLRDKVLAAEGSLVIRPDSGDPPKVMIELLDLIESKFGATLNEKGYKVLNPKVRLIWGDGLEPRTIESILFRMKLHGWSAENTVFGMGGGLLQKVNRDTQRFAFKASSVVVNGEERAVFKQPVGDQSKASKRGRLKLVKQTTLTRDLMTSKSLGTVNESDPSPDLLQTVYAHGRLGKRTSLDDIRERTGMVAPVTA